LEQRQAVLEYVFEVLMIDVVADGLIFVGPATSRINTSERVSFDPALLITFTTKLTKYVPGAETVIRSPPTTENAVPVISDETMGTLV